MDLLGRFTSGLLALFLANGIPLIVLGFIWHWAAEILGELRAINKHLAEIASAQGQPK